MILKKYLMGKFKYIGIDYQIKNRESKDFINHNLENGLPEIDKVEIITAVDVLEHLENIHDIFASLFLLSKKKIVIAPKNWTVDIKSANTDLIPKNWKIF